ncbi:MAG: hypothetical protein K6E35_04525 [Bacteroidales bacterium]|nr:hypothetical protein [Bacteroidales bacterium]
MTSLISKISFVAVALMMAVSLCNAQDARMGQMIDQVVTRIDRNDPQAFLTGIAELKRIEAMYPDVVTPKYYTALESLNFSILNPHAEQTEVLMEEVGERIQALEERKDTDQSDLYTLKGFFYMVRIVQDPARNGQRYYFDVMKYYEKALKINPDNELAKGLQEKFYEGMNQSMQ